MYYEPTHTLLWGMTLMSDSERFNKSESKLYSYCTPEKDIRVREK